MVTIENVGTVSWREDTCFTLKEYHANLTEMIEVEKQKREEAEGSHQIPRAGRISKKIEIFELMRSSNLLNVTLVIQLENVGTFVPVPGVARKDNRYHWEYDSQDYDPWDLEHHEVVRIIHGCGQKFGPCPVYISLDYFEGISLSISFCLTEDIDDSHRYLEALALEMQEWAKPALTRV